MSNAVEAIAEFDNDTQEDARRGIPFIKLREGKCKFPLGRLSEPPLRFCGEPAAIGSPYCGHCRRIVYAPSVRR